MGFVVDEVALDRVFSEYLGLPLSVLFHQCSILIFNLFTNDAI
jgi:hypothetical protein